jgi:hypothetical protein
MQPAKEKELGLQALSREFRAKEHLRRVNSKFKFLGKFGRSFIMRRDRLRNSRISNSNGGPGSSIGNHFLLNFRSSI